MSNRRELKKIANTRLKEVEILFNNQLYDGAKYLSGYVIEIALKARICKILNSDYPESGEISRSFLTHKLDNLVRLAGLQKALDKELSSNVNFKTNWSILTSWTESFRYKPIGSSSKMEMLNIISALKDESDGILTWIKRRW